MLSDKDFERLDTVAHRVMTLLQAAHAPRATDVMQLPLATREALDEIRRLRRELAQMGDWVESATSELRELCELYKESE